MFPSASTFFVLALSATSALADVFVTSPVANTAFGGGAEATISWMEGKTPVPSLKEFGLARVAIYVGNVNQQTQLQVVSESVDVSTTASILFTPDASIGPNSKEYFIRFESLALKNGQYAALAFSSKFEMNGMTGDFSPAALAQIEDKTAPKVGETAPAPSASASVSAPAVSKSAVVANASLSASAAKASSTIPATGSANTIVASGFAALFAAALVVLA